VVRFGKKKIAATIVLVAVMVGALGVTAIGEKSYFFRQVVNPDQRKTIDNDTNKNDIGTLEQAYAQIEELGIPVLKLGYMPPELIFESIEISRDSAIIIFQCQGNKIHFYQESKDSSTSKDVYSDRKEENIVYNEWLKDDVVIKSNTLKNGQTECGVEVKLDKSVYRLEGVSNKEEFIKIAKNLFF